MNCNYKVKLDDIQNKYKFNIFCTGSYNDSDLRKMIESVFYALPRTSGSGASVTLNDTARSYMHNELNATDTSQYSTTGKNLCDFENPSGTNNCTYDSSTKIYTSNAISTNYGGFNAYVNSTPLKIPTGESTFYFSVDVRLKSGTYTKKLNYFRNGVSITNTTQTLEEISNPNVTNSFQRYVFKVVYTNSSGSTQNCSNFFIQFKENLSSAVFEVKNLMISTSSDTTYEEYTNGASPNPDYPQVIHTITGDNTIKVANENLFVIGNARLGARLSGTGTDYDEDDTSKNYFISDYIVVNEGEAYTTNANIYNLVRISYYDKDKVWISNNSSNNRFTIPTNCKFIRFCDLQTNINTTMLVKGDYTSSNFPTYVEGKNNSEELTLGDKEICKIGNYEDKIFKAIKGNEVYDSLASEEKATLDYGKWYLRKAIGKVVLNGSESYSNNGQVGTVTEYVYTPIIAKEYGKLNMICDYFTCSEISGERILGRDNNGNVYFRILTTTASDTTAFKTWLSTHNTEVYYILSTPTNELFNDTIQEQLEDIYNNMLSYEGQTNVSQVNDDLPFNINSTAIKDLNDL